MALEQRPNLTDSELPGRLRCRRHFQKFPDPSPVIDTSECENLGEIPMQLLAQAITECDAIRFELILHSTELAELNQQGVAQACSAKSCRICAQRIREHKGVASVILGTRNRDRK